MAVLGQATLGTTPKVMQWMQCRNTEEAVGHATNLCLFKQCIPTLDQRTVQAAVLIRQRGALGARRHPPGRPALARRVIPKE